MSLRQQKRTLSKYLLIDYIFFRNIIQPQLALRQEQPIRPRLAAVQHIRPRAPIDPTRTFRPVQQASPTRPKQQIRVKNT